RFLLWRGCNRYYVTDEMVISQYGDDVSLIVNYCHDLQAVTRHTVGGTPWSKFRLVGFETYLDMLEYRGRWYDLDEVKASTDRFAD
ncbi:hypothetical protein PFISCL1PPCAC_23293, partial [Pristionchus fissidentatus]